MKFKTKKIGVLLIVGLFFPLTLNYTFNSSNNSESTIFNPKPSTGYTESFIHIDGSIPGNWTATEGKPWCNLVNGIYIIENVTIDVSTSPTGSGILINNSKNEKFIIRNCTILNADYLFFDSGIWLENTNNGTIIENNCSNNHQGIYLVNCKGNNITENTVNNNQYNGIYLDTNCNKNNIKGNTLNKNMFGIQLVTNCDYNNITFNTATNNDDYGIFINSFGGSCDNNIILNNTANENTRIGIYIQYNNNKNSIINNTVNGNGDTGISMLTSNDINVSGNIITNNNRGIYAQDCDNSNITDNIINSNIEIGIYFYYNSDNNQIKNNTINQNDLGIALDQSDFNNITLNTLTDNSWCIFETNCEGNIIEYNDCSVPKVDSPIFIDGSATGVGAHNWTWVEQQSWFGGGLGTKNVPYSIENLKISGFGLTNLNGIEIINSNVYFIIQGCEIYNSKAAISLQRVNNSLLINNNCSNNINNGIDLEDECYYNNITKNTCNDNQQGISLYLNSCYNHITNNTMYGNNNGIYLDNDCNSTIISGNKAYFNIEAGIYLSYCGYNTITENIASGNINDGIFLEEDCDNNTISLNIFNNNNIGIDLYYSDFNNIIDNIANNNNYNGIEIEVGNYNTIIGNTLSNNTVFGIYLEADSNNNSIFRNYFLKNGKHAYDDGANNKWNSATIGNYWDNHTGPDNNHNGIVDIPYTYIGGSAGSIDYLPIASITPGGLDPGIIAVIVVVSILGGLALIGAILVILLKKGKISLEKLKRFSFSKK